MLVQTICPSAMLYNICGSIKPINITWYARSVNE